MNVRVEFRAKEGRKNEDVSRCCKGDVEIEGDWLLADMRLHSGWNEVPLNRLDEDLVEVEVFCDFGKVDADIS